MIAKLIENGGCFSVEFKAETIADAALLSRMAVNATKEIRNLNAYAHNDGTFSGSIVIGKAKNNDSSLRRTRAGR